MEQNLESRLLKTLEIAHRWGHGLTIAQLSAGLYGGSVQLAVIDALTAQMPGVVRDNGIAVLHGAEQFLAKTRYRSEVHERLREEREQLARTFATTMGACCPFVRCIGLTGSLASGGYAPGDDVDFNLFTANGTRHLAYLAATLLGVRCSLQYRRNWRPGRTSLLPKVICVNAVWTDDQTRPFERTDEHMAYELLRTRPLIGAEHFEGVLESNPWLARHFPQALTRAWQPEPPRGMNRTGQLLAKLAAHRLTRGLLDFLCAAVSWLLYAAAQAAKLPNREAREHGQFMRSVKYPYEIFQV